MLVSATPSPCPELRGLNTFVAEHVYEAQLVPLFMKWLALKPLPAGYTNPSYAWVSEVVIGIEGPNGFRTFGVPNYKTDDVWAEMVLGLPGNQNLNRLALCHKGVNGRKGVFFEEKKDPSAANEQNDKDTRIMQRNVSIIHNRYVCWR